ncbi:MAG: hypothetical protein ACFFD5_10135 [Candidatus Thorarchaeota archaeon]
MSEELNRFLRFLNYQIDQKNKFDNIVRKIPLFKNELEDSYHTILKMIDINRREIFKMLLKEFKTLS